MTDYSDLRQAMHRAPRVRLGDLIEQTDNRNSEGQLGEDDVRGISIQKKIIPTKADMTGVSLKPYKILAPKEFCYVTVTSRNGGKISLAMNDSDKSYIFSSSYITFKVKDEERLNPHYLYLMLSRAEFDRYSRYHSWGSARETFDWPEMERVVIPLPSIKVQRELMAIYEGLRKMADDNEALLDPLSAACHAYIVDCKAKYPSQPLGNFVEDYTKKNIDNVLGESEVRGISTDKIFTPTKANLDGVSLHTYKIVEPGTFAYVADTSRRGDKMALGYNSTSAPILISSIYTTFKSKDEKVLLPEYLYLFLARPEFDRYSRFNSWGSARETFDWPEMQRVQIPVPPIEVQEAIVSLYRCAEEAKKIAAEARALMRDLCPALVQRAANSN